MRRVAILLVVLGCDRSSAETPATVDAPASAPAPATAPPTLPPTAASDTLHIELVTSTQWRIEESALTEIALELLAGHVTCASADDGCTLGALDRSTVLPRLGFEAGDKLRTLAGVPLADGASLHSAIHAARSQGVFAIELQRGSEARRHRYRIRTLVPRSARVDELERGVDMLAEAVRREPGNRIVVDPAAIELLASALESDARATLQMLGVDPEARFVSVGGIPTRGAADAATVLRATADAPVALELVAPDESPIRLAIEHHENLVDPVVLTAIRVSLPTRPELRDPAVPATPSEPGIMFDGLTAVSETEFTITRAAFERIFADGMTVTRAVRIVPDVDARGLKLYGIRAGAVDRFSPKQIGIRNGDIVTSINGAPLGTALEAADAFHLARKAERIVIELQRRGSPITVTISVVG